MKNTIKKILVFIIPVLILLTIQQAFYPAIMSYDSLMQWNQVQSGKIDDGHPFLTTFVMNLLSKIWNNPGIVVIFHILIFSIIWGIICLYLNKKNYRKNYIFLIIMCLFPIIYLYTLTLWKDVIYSYILLLISFMILKGVDKNYNYNIKETLLLGVTLVLTVLYRHNGIIVAFLTLLLLIYKFLKNKIKFKKIIVLLLTVVAAYQILNIPKNLFLYEGPRDRVESGLTAADSYAVFILSTFYNNNAVTNDNDLNILHNITDKETWTTYYDPYLINTLLFRQEINVNYVVNNRDKVYNLLIKYCIKKPQYLLKHYLLSDSMLYNPLPIGALYVFEFGEWNPNYGFYSNTTTHIPFLKDILTHQIRFTYGYPYILNVLLYRPIYPLAMSILMIYILYKNKLVKKDYFLVTAPMLFNTLSLLPINPAQDVRYVYINFLTGFFVTFIFINKMQFKKNISQNNNRNTNIDLIKFTACFFVIAVHSLSKIGYYDLVINNSENYFFTMLRSLFINCVPLFMIATGFLMSNKQISNNYYKGFIKTIILAIIIGFLCMIFNNNITYKSIIRNLINFESAGYSWYVRMYIGLFLLIPFLNVISNNLNNRKHYLILIFTIILLTSIPSVFVSNGFSIINSWWSGIYPLMYYFIGAYIRKYNPKIKKNISFILFIIFLITNTLINIYFSYDRKFMSSTINDYHSTGILLTTLFLFIWLLKVNTRKLPYIFIWIIEKTSKLSLPLYLISQIFDQTIYNLINPYLNSKIIFAFTGMISVFICSFICAYILDLSYDKILKKPINLIYDKTINVGNKILDRILLITT